MVRAEWSTPLAVLSTASSRVLFLLEDSPTRKELYLCFHLVCIPWGITRTSVARFSSKLLRGVAPVPAPFSPLLALCRGFPDSRLARTRSNPDAAQGNSTNPLRIHRAPLANSSLAPNVFLSALPFTVTVPLRFPSRLLPAALPIPDTPEGALRQLLGPLSASPLRFHARRETSVIRRFRNGCFSRLEWKGWKFGC